MLGDLKGLLQASRLIYSEGKSSDPRGMNDVLTPAKPPPFSSRQVCHVTSTYTLQSPFPVFALSQTVQLCSPPSTHLIVLMHFINAVLISAWFPLWFCSFAAQTCRIKTELVAQVKMGIWACSCEKYFHLLPLGIWSVYLHGYTSCDLAPWGGLYWKWRGYLLRKWTLS